MREPAKPYGLKGRRKPSKLPPYKPYLQELMNQEIFNCVVRLTIKSQAPFQKCREFVISYKLHDK